MSSCDGAENVSALLRRLERDLRPTRPRTLRPDHSHDVASSCAAVAVILRVRGSLSSAAQQDVDSFLAQGLSEDASIEVLFMVRAHNPRDQFSGDVAFPGGRSSASETLRATVIRETREEVGLDISLGSGYVFLGTLPVEQTSFTKPWLAVHPCVFLQTHPETAPFHLEITEVAAVRWVRLSHFVDNFNLHSHLRPYRWDVLSQVAKYHPLVRRAASLAGVTTVYYSMAELPFAALAEGGNDSPETQFLLWGLTLRITSTLLAACGFPHIWNRSTTFSLAGDLVLEAQRRLTEPSHTGKVVVGAAVLAAILAREPIAAFVRAKL